MASKSFMTPMMREKVYRDAIIQWRKELEDDRGERARLRRCQEPLQVLLLSSYYQLKAVLTDWPENQPLALAAAVGLIANAEYQEGAFSTKSFAAQLGSAKSDDAGPILSKARFRQLIKCHDWPEFYRRMRRAIRMVKGSANIISIVDCVLQYGYEQRGDFKPEPSAGFQFRLAEDYYLESLTKGKKEAS